MFKIAFVMPTYFDPNSVIAGGERYAYGLAKAVSEKVSTTLITFSTQNRTLQDGRLTIRHSKVLFKAGGISNPFSLDFIKDIKNFDAVHCLQHRTLVTEFAILAAAAAKKPAFVTDLAGGTYYCLSRFFPVEKAIREFLLISEFNKSQNPNIKRPHRIIYGGVDTEYFSPAPQGETKSGFLYVGRIFRLKGIHHLIEGMPMGAALQIAGQNCEPDYEQELKSLARKKTNIQFAGSPSDEVVKSHYRKSLATVLPSLVDGGFTSAMESMACGTPVIGTRLGSLPEIIQDGVTGFLVEPNSPQALREKIEYFMKHPEEALKMGERAREDVLKRFTWDKVADRCLEAYQAP